MRSVFFITIRRLRAPLILIILIFALSIAGLCLIPGVDENGQPWRMSLFQAFYFVTFTATTIGFGEIPHTFTDQQRLFVTLIIYASVLGWAYLLGTFLNLAQDKGFQHAIVSERFRRSVARLREPFYLVCGLGETGMTVVHSLDKLGYRFAAIDKDERRIEEWHIEDMSSDAPALAADARSPEILTDAGLLKPECQGVLALCNDDDSNLAVAISACLLRPGLPVIARAESPAVAASMVSLGTYRVINPFREFADHLELAIRAPDNYRLLAWLTSSYGSYLPQGAPPRMPSPPGHWIVCGYGPFGHEMGSAIQRGGFKATLVDPTGIQAHGLRAIDGMGSGTAVLREAGAETALGIFAGTDDDMANLAISIAARRINPGIFIILRQNLQANQMLFSRFGADMTMISSQIIANECIAVLRTPLLADFLGLVRRKNDLWAYSLAENLRVLTGQETPDFWSFRVDQTEAPGLADVVERLQKPVNIGALSKHAKTREDRIACLALMVLRDGRMIELPGDEFEIAIGDRLLFAGRRAAKEVQYQMLHYPSVAAYVMGLQSDSEGWLWRAVERTLGR